MVAKTRTPTPEIAIRMTPMMKMKPTATAIRAKTPVVMTPTLEMGARTRTTALAMVPGMGTATGMAMAPAMETIKPAMMATITVMTTAMGRMMAMTRSQPYRRHRDRKSTRLNSSHVAISYAVFCLKKKTDKDDVIKKDNLR